MPAITNDPAAFIALGLGLAWLAGMRVYLVLCVLGVALARDAIALPPDLHVLASTWAIGACAVLALLEAFVDKIPGLDGSWDLAQTCVRVPVGTWLGAVLLSPHGRPGPAMLSLAAAIVLASHLLKTITRQRINTSAEPLSNWIASLTEDLICGVALFVLATSARAVPAIAIGGSVVISGTTFFAFRDVARRPARPRLGAAA